MGKSVMATLAANPFMPFKVVSMLLRSGADRKERENGKLHLRTLAMRLERECQAKAVACLKNFENVEVIAACYSIGRLSKGARIRVLNSDMIRSVKEMLY
jgi:hypothetical protein